MIVFSGCTKFASEVQAFSDHGHQVETCGIDGNVTYLQDIRTFHPDKNKHYFFMTFHPPCTQYSKANWRLGKFKNRVIDHSIVLACLRIVREAKPAYWMIENPEGAMRLILGEPQYKIKYGDFGHYCQKPTHLWGILPYFEIPKGLNHVQKGHHNKTAFTLGKRDAASKSLIPYKLSEILCNAIEREYNRQLWND